MMLMNLNLKGACSIKRTGLLIGHKFIVVVLAQVLTAK